VSASRLAIAREAVLLMRDTVRKSSQEKQPREDGA